MTGPEIQAIIHQSAQSNVREIDLPGLRLSFGEGGPAKAPVTPVAAFETTRAPETALSEEQHAKQDRETLESEEAISKEARLALMIIEDPMEYERLVTSGQLFDETEGDGDYGNDED